MIINIMFLESMELVPYLIHSQIKLVVNHFKLKAFDMEEYIFDKVRENNKYLQTLEPRDWREQDHYAVLRLSKVRFNASQELIKQVSILNLIIPFPLFNKLKKSFSVLLNQHLKEILAGPKFNPLCN